MKRKSQNCSCFLDNTIAFFKNVREKNYQDNHEFKVLAEQPSKIEFLLFTTTNNDVSRIMTKTATNITENLQIDYMY